MNAEFIKLVASMRAAQKEFYEMRTRSAMMLAIKLETQVDQYIQRWTAEKVQLEMWARSMQTDETPGVYNVADETKTQDGGAA